MNKIIILLLFIAFNTYGHSSRSPKIVALVQVRNEENFLEIFLKALSQYVDSIVLLDDASTDKTREIALALQHECNIEKILHNDIPCWETRSETDNQQLLLNAGRSIGGTHFERPAFNSNC